MERLKESLLLSLLSRLLSPLCCPLSLLSSLTSVVSCLLSVLCCLLSSISFLLSPFGLAAALHLAPPQLLNAAIDMKERHLFLWFSSFIFFLVSP